MANTPNDLFSTRVVVVHPEGRFRDVSEELLRAHAEYCVVVEEETGAYLGLVRLRDAVALTGGANRIFADLINPAGLERRIREDEATEAVLGAFSSDKNVLLAVVNDAGQFKGLITIESAWSWLVEAQAAQQKQLQVMFDEQQLLGDFLEKKVEQRTASLRAALNQFREASAILSHDVSGPLRTIQSFAEMLSTGECGELNAEGKAYLERLMRAATKLESLAAEILGRARAAGKAAPAPVHTVDLDEVFADALELSQALLLERSAVVTRRGALHPVSGRYVPLLQIVSNLLVNAVKYVPEGRAPVVEIWSDERDGRVVLYVKDNGRGIPASESQAIFEPFVRLDEHTPGSGLGLSIARNAAVGLGGAIRLEPASSAAGSVFAVVLNPAVGMEADA